tara:strand:- start:153 stop:470 length:318 start_codon:yes stop_codon:yes gene_type:complete
MKCCDNCKCDKPVIDVAMFVPEGCEIGKVEIFKVNKKREKVGEFKAGCVESDEDLDDPDYEPVDTGSPDPYEHADLTDADKEELRKELTDILIDMAQDELDEMNN